MRVPFHLSDTIVGSGEDVLTKITTHARELHFGRNQVLQGVSVLESKPATARTGTGRSNIQHSDHLIPFTHVPNRSTRQDSGESPNTHFALYSRGLSRPTATQRARRSPRKAKLGKKPDAALKIVI
jgi:hypothetical protein